MPTRSGLIGLPGSRVCTVTRTSRSAVGTASALKTRVEPRSRKQRIAFCIIRSCSRFFHLVESRARNGTEGIAKNRMDVCRGELSQEPPVRQLLGNFELV